MYRAVVITLLLQANSDPDKTEHGHSMAPQPGTIRISQATHITSASWIEKDKNSCLLLD